MFGDLQTMSLQWKVVCKEMVVCADRRHTTTLTGVNVGGDVVPKPLTYRATKLPCLQQRLRCDSLTIACRIPSMIMPDYSILPTF